MYRRSVELRSFIERRPGVEAAVATPRASLVGAHRGSMMTTPGGRADRAISQNRTPALRQKEGR